MSVNVSMRRALVGATMVSGAVAIAFSTYGTAAADTLAGPEGEALSFGAFNVTSPLTHATRPAPLAASDGETCTCSFVRVSVRPAPDC